MEFFTEKKQKHTNIIDDVGLKKGELVKIYRPPTYRGPSLNVFNYKGYNCEVVENQKYNSDEIYVRILCKNTFIVIKINKHFLSRI